MNPIPKFVFNLDLPVSERWKIMIHHFQPVFPQLKRTIQKLIKQMGLSPVTWYGFKALVWTYYKLGFILHCDEIQSIATCLNLEFEEVLLMQLIYESSALCTSVITKVLTKQDEEKENNGQNEHAQKSQYSHARSMDWSMPILSALTVELEIIKKGRIIGHAISWFGYVGFLTGVSSQHYTVAINYRRSMDGSLVNNITKTLGRSWPIGYAVRYALTEELPSNRSIHFLSTCSLIAPCYITMSFDNQDPIKIIRGNGEQLVSLTKSPYCIQTNIDVAKCEVDRNQEEKYISIQPNILKSEERHKLAKMLLDENQNCFLSEQQLYNNFMQYPIVNESTIYVCIMNPNNCKISHCGVVKN